MREEQKEKLKKIILDIEKDPALPKMKEKELMHFLGIPVEEKKAFASLLSEMEEEGVLEGVLSPSEKEGGTKKPHTLKGVYSRAKKGFGFVSLSEKELEDIFIPSGAEAGAMDGDTVQIQIVKKKEGDEKAEGRVVKVMQHAVKEVLGLVKARKEGLFLFPDNVKLPSPFYIHPGKTKGAVPGDKVVAKILSYGGEKKEKLRRGRTSIPRHTHSPLLSYPLCAVTEILGAVTDPGVDILSVIRAFSLPEDGRGGSRAIREQKRSAQPSDHYHRRRRREGSRRRHFPGIFSGKEAVSPLRSYCRCHKLCERRQSTGSGSTGSRDLRIPHGSGDSDASAGTLKWHLLPPRRGRSAHFELYHGLRRGRRTIVS